MSKQKFVHYVVQTIMFGFGVMTAGMIVFAFITILNNLYE